MPRALPATILPFLAALLLPLEALSAGDGAAVSPGWVPTPRGQRLPISATNRPFLAADRAQSPVDLVAAGYVEEELLVSGRSSLYDWGATARAPVVERGPGEAWTTRMLVRRPKEASRFSGRVILELLDAPEQYDVAPLWGLSHAHFMRSGDVWVGLSIKPAALLALQSFDQVRYAQVKLPAPESLGCAPDPQGENGLAWDMIAQAGALLRSASKEGPLAAFHPRRVILAGHGDAGSHVVTYANAMNARWRLVGGMPVFDGYLDLSGTRARPLNPCAATLADNDPRNGVQPRDVPFVAVMTQSDVARVLPVRRASSDSPRDLFRYFELAGVSRVGASPAGRPATADLAIAGIGPPSEETCEEAPSDYPSGFALNALWQQYETLLLAGESMIQTPRIDTGPGGSPALDSHGNARGGWRLPPIDVPLASYASHCANAGSMKALVPAQLRQMYKDRGGYLKRFNEAVDNAVDGRRLLPEDAQSLKSPAARKVPAF